jgi:hypothetical protein
VHDPGLVALHEIRPVAVALEELGQLLSGDAGQDGRVGDLVPVQVQDREYDPVTTGMHELVGVPGGGQRPGFRLPVAHHAGDDQVGVVERRPVGVDQRVPQLASLVDRAGRLRRHVGGDPARKAELAEQTPHPFFVRGDLRVHLAVGAFEIGAGDNARPPMPRAADEHHVEVALGDHPVEVGVDEVEPRSRAPVAEQTGFDVGQREGLTQHRVAAQVDLADRQVIGGPPPSVDQGEFLASGVLGQSRGHIASLVESAQSAEQKGSGQSLSSTLVTSARFGGATPQAKAGPLRRTESRAGLNRWSTGEKPRKG